MTGVYDDIAATVGQTPLVRIRKLAGQELTPGPHRVEGIGARRAVPWPRAARLDRLVMTIKSARGPWPDVREHRGR